MALELFVVDTSALFALIEDEEGADRVQEVLAAGGVILPWIVPLELLYVTEQERGREEAEIRYAMVKRLPIRILSEVTEPWLLAAARIKAVHRLSLADSMVAATALREGATLLHKDPEFEALAKNMPLEALPYKA